MKHCMMNNNIDRTDDMEINEGSADNGTMWEAEPIVVLPPNTPSSMPSTQSTTTQSMTTQSTAQNGATSQSTMTQSTTTQSGATAQGRRANTSQNSNMSACADGTSPVPARASANMASRNTTNASLLNTNTASPVADVAPAQTLNVSTSPRAADPAYLQGYLQQHIGKYVQIYFMIGTQQNAQRDGILNELGSNFLVIREVGSNRLIVCDLYSVKFVNVYDLCEKDLQVL